ncbi:hypothetical protein PC116_g25743 [Phytophthora cactorum]|uniref:Uncharacterized protein n=1 Tax=Phytophthora cactorum TaxID=29920 RepID=A0A8T1AII5_9STRA|nr:hypothetical protein Pcac1_g27056 [Phytophthora cactorum]KAG2876999.1 hypothetical protein PC114_g23893 [Phytophthora cactorum]KAG2879791.1 hypothetical protein PC117_g26690 [Phytophthora cactorum]KAG2959141.1 hypothetical protein PC119_g26801 [Phytophthora cactorum]KAG2968728.1 hypothetical protein PC120_g26783 [Phytophthora cactorum]
MILHCAQPWLEGHYGSSETADWKDIVAGAVRQAARYTCHTNMTSTSGIPTDTFYNGGGY